MFSVGFGRQSPDAGLHVLDDVSGTLRRSLFGRLPESQVDFPPVFACIVKPGGHDRNGHPQRDRRASEPGEAGLVRAFERRGLQGILSGSECRLEIPARGCPDA